METLTHLKKLLNSLEEAPYDVELYRVSRLCDALCDA